MTTQSNNNGGTPFGPMELYLIGKASEKALFTLETVKNGPSTYAKRMVVRQDVIAYLHKEIDKLQCVTGQVGGGCYAPASQMRQGVAPIRKVLSALVKQAVDRC